MIEQAEREGRLMPGKTIIEPTSGNTGIGLAIIGIVKGYPVEIVMSEAVSVERRKIIRSYGGKVILTPAAEGTDGAIRKAHQLVEENPGKYFMPDQFSNAGNYQAHYENTAIEIWQQMEGEIDYLVSALGTSGTIMGISRFLKRCKPDIKSCPRIREGALHSRSKEYGRGDCSGYLRSLPDRYTGDGGERGGYCHGS